MHVRSPAVRSSTRLRRSGIIGLMSEVNQRRTWMDDRLHTYIHKKFLKWPK